MGNERSPLRPAGKGFVPRPISALKVPERAGANKPVTGGVPARPETQRRNQPQAAPAIEPTLLLVGADDKFAPALRIALARHRMYVETAELADVADTVVVTAPDLVLLAGEAARDGGAAVLARLAGSSATSVVPVAILDDNTALDVRLRAFRHGAVAVIQRTASIDAIANEVARLAREIPERGGEALGVVGEATLSEFVNALGKELRSGILSLKTEGGEAPVRLVLGSGRPLAELIDEFVKRASGHVVKAEPLEYEFDGRANGTIQLLGAETESAPGAIGGLRVALADDDPARADVIAQELRARGATVVVVDMQPTDLQFSRLRQIDPEVLLVGEQHVQGAGYALIRKMRRDTRLRWASLLVVRWDEVWSDRVAVPAIDRLTGALRALTEGDRGLRERVDADEPFDTRLEITGPARCLRAIAASSRSLRVTVFNPRVRVSVDLSEGLVAGASAESVEGDAPSGEPWDGTHALAALLVLSSGRVRIEPVQQPATTNVMATIDVALSLADQEAPPIAPSIPATTGSSFPPPSDQAPTVRLEGAPLIPVGMPRSEAVTSRDLPRAPAPFEEPPVSATSPFVRVSVTPPGAYPLVPAPPPAEGAPAFRPMQPTLPGGIEAPNLPEPAPFPAPAPPPFEAPAPPPFGSLPPPSASLPPVSATPSPTAFTRSTVDLVGAAKQAAGVKRQGVSPALAMLLVSLAALQGALLAIGHWWLTKDDPSHSPAGETATPSDGASEGATPGAKEPPKGDRAETQGGNSQVPLPPGTPLKPDPSAISETERVTGVDESGVRAPSCEDLFNGQRVPEGEFPGAAYEQQRLAERAIVRGEVDEAELSYCKAVRWNKGSVGRYIDLAQFMLIRRDGARAADWAKRALEVQPGNTRAYNLLGDGLARIGDVKGAEQAWFIALGTSAPTPKQRDEFVQKSMQEATLSTVKRDFTRAERFFRRAIIVDPNHLKAALGLASCLVKLGEPKPAMLWAQRALAIDPRNAAARVAMGDAHLAAGDARLAETEWREALGVDPGNGEALLRLNKLTGKTP